MLKVEGEAEQLAVLQEVVANKWNVRETEAFLEEKLRAPEPEPTPARRPQMLKIIKDVRIFINTIGELVKQMKKAGLDVQLRQEQDENTVTITMVVPKRR